MSFKDEQFSRRFSQMGDEAEQQYELASPHGSWERYGLNRPAVSMKGMPAFLRHTPDYVTANRFVEVQGFGSDRMIKLKVEKMTALQFWDGMWGLDIWLWDSRQKRWAYAPLSTFQKAIDAGMSELRYFFDGKSYFAIPCKNLDLDWHKVEVDA